MTAAPSWSRDDRPSAEENAAAKMKADIAATKLHLGGTGRLPVDQEAARRELSEEQRHNRGTRPNSRRWKALDKLDEEIDRVRRRHAEAISRLTAAEETLTQAPDADARSLAAWLSSGEKGTRPSASVYEKTRDRDAAVLLVSAIGVELDEKLEQRLAYIQRHRPKMLADSQQAVDQARQELLGKVSELPELRQALLDAREVALWLSHYPEPAGNYGFPGAVALGIRKPVEAALGTTAMVEYTSLVSLLRADADTLSSTFSAEQRKQLGHPDTATPISEAMWNDDERAVTWRKAELERARQLAEYHPDPNKVATDARDLRP